MATYIFNGECPSGMKQAFINAYKPQSTYHADTWYKYDGDTEWRIVSITGEIVCGEETPTTQIPDVTNVIELEIGSDVTSIGQAAFGGCSILTSVIIPDTVTSIGNGAFFGCNGLENVTIGNGVTSIGDGAFWSCAGLTSVTIPNNVTSIGENALAECNGLISVTFFGKDKSTVQGMSNYSWELFPDCVLHCTDGDITI